MYQNELNLRQLLKRARLQLLKPVVDNQQRLLLVVNTTYLLLTTLFLTTEWYSTGKAVPSEWLSYVYLFVGLTNAISALYSYVYMSPAQTRIILGFRLHFTTYNGVEKRLRWLSLVSIMFMSFCNMMGFGNPSDDALLTDFALGHSLIILIAMLLGRNASLFWFCIVLGVLVHTTFNRKGYSYQYNYLTPTESRNYQTALAKKQPWALQRQQVLALNHLNPPHVSRYFNTWLIFILVAYLSADYFTESARKLNEIIPTVAENMQQAIQETYRQEVMQLRDDEERQQQKQEALNAELRNLKAQINPHFLFNTLNYFYMKSLEHSDDLANSILMLSDIMQYSVRDSIDRVGLDEEIKHMKQFIELLQLRNNHKLCIDFSVEGPVYKIQVLPFLFIGLLENAFKHGNMLNPDKPLVITIKANPPHLDFYSCNQKNLKKRVVSTQIGLANTRRRLELTYQNFEFSIDQDEESFCIKLLLDTHDEKQSFSSNSHS